MKVTANTLANLIIISTLLFLISSVILIVLSITESIFICDMYLFLVTFVIWVSSAIFLFDLPDFIIDAEQEF